MNDRIKFLRSAMAQHIQIFGNEHWHRPNSRVGLGITARLVWPLHPEQIGSQPGP
jgi:hypothetical protein